MNTEQEISSPEHEELAQMEAAEQVPVLENDEDSSAEIIQTEHEEPTQDEPEVLEEEEPKDSKAEQLSPELQSKIGKAISAERKRIRQEYENKIAQLRQTQEISSKNQNAPKDSIWDPELGEYVGLNTPIGQQILRNYKIAEKRQYQTAEMEAQQLRDSVEDGYSRYDHDKYDNAKTTFLNLGTDPMAEALKGADDVAAVIYYLGAKPSELKRISQLSPAKQMREIHRIDELVSPRKKMVTQATPPMRPINSNKNYAIDPADQSWSQREEYWRKINNPR